MVTLCIALPKMNKNRKKKWWNLTYAFLKKDY